MFFNISQNHNLHKSASMRGFGLIELMVSMSIMALVSTVILVNNRSFNSALLLRAQAQEIAFALRQVQLLAVSGNQEETSTSKQFGVYFDTSSGNETRYRLFRDDGGVSGRYDSGTDSTISVGTIDSRFSIVGIVNAANSSVGSSASITFVRPNFDALINTGGNSAVSISPIYINIAPKDSPTNIRQVEVTATGQISVK